MVSLCGDSECCAPLNLLVQLRNLQRVLLKLVRVVRLLALA